MPLSPATGRSVGSRGVGNVGGTAPAFLDTMCAGDAGSRARLAELFDRPDERSAVPDQPLPAIKIESPLEDEVIGKNVGPYKLLQKIGEGGCGAVYQTGLQMKIGRDHEAKVYLNGKEIYMREEGHMFQTKTW